MFNNTEFTTLEVKFTQSDLLDESKKRAIETYDENNKCLGLIFNTGIEAYDENSDLDDECLCDMPILSKDEEFDELSNVFKETITLLKNGEMQKAAELGSSYGIYNPDHPMISFLPINHEKRKEKLSQSKNLLPWTSADSITIFPL
ncbi:hypothetical protein SteCoe_16406 [Stentor coeruleus]|uniref:Uncharacterized protein n=1 Tax=Stentor coeruleus TaxID=5963 RepID=A0A1R2C1I1_9CILI|nr:hypothetical protein SteCoe_16406 [Stentor coeruleus]